jgi:hypothetical protein
MPEDFERRDDQRRVWAAFCQSFDSRLRSGGPHPPDCHSTCGLISGLHQSKAGFAAFEAGAGLTMK